MPMRRGGPGGLTGGISSATSSITSSSIRAPGGRPAVYASRDGGDSWQRHDAGLPAGQAWWTVKRQAMTADAGARVDLYLGTTSGELWQGRDEGRQWECLARHLPEIYAVEAACAC